MFFVIDSNEYIFAFGPSKESSVSELFDKLLETDNRHIIRIPRTIFEEVRRNLSPEAFHEFNKFINALTVIDEDIVVPFEIAFKYEIKGLKPADAFIAAYFLSRNPDLPFKVLTADKCLKLI